MSRLLSLLLAWLVLAVQSPLALGQPPAESERQARAVFVALIDAARQRDTARFKRLIAAADLRQMEAMEREQAGFFDAMMAMLDEIEPAGFSADVQPSRVTFRREIVLDGADSRGRQTVTFTMVKEGQQWRFGRAP